MTVPELFRDLQLQKFNKDVIAAIIFMLLSSQDGDGLQVLPTHTYPQH